MVFRWANLVMGLLRDTGHHQVSNAIGFGFSAAALWYLVDAQKRLEVRINELQESTEFVEWLLTDQNYNAFLSEMKLARKDKEKMVAFLKNQV
ncbi:hypothetical protein MKW92_046889 [Papaver armeniacum]|nr:hypothetical protein MKW92_046889 [Papaver armeniacum]